MARKQTRRTVSLQRSVYDALKSHCEQNHLSMAVVVEKLLAAELHLELPSPEQRSLERQVKSNIASGYRAVTVEEVMARRAELDEQAKRALAVKERRRRSAANDEVEQRRRGQEWLARAKADLAEPQIHRMSPYDVSKALAPLQSGSRPFCAVCTGDIVGVPVREPIGKNGGLVNVCADCSTKTAGGGRAHDYRAGVGFVKRSAV